MKKVINKACWVLIVVLIWNVGTSMAQNRTETVAATDDKYKVEKIIFKNEEGEVVSTYDVEANNPFASKVQAAKALQSSSANARASQGNKVKDFVSNSGLYLDDQAGQYTMDSAALASNIIYTRDKDVRGVVQGIDLYSKYGNLRGNESEVTIFDDNGKVVNKVRLATNYVAAAITDDLKLMVVRHGGVVDHDGYQLFVAGASVYDLETKNEVKRIEIEPGYFQVIAPMTFSNNYVLLEMKGMDSYKIFVINSLERKIYERVFPKKLWWAVVSKTEKGFVVDEGNSEYIIPFSDDFQKSTY
ncbi:MAG: hypothetical protein OCD76_23065 [Reichenbachiella sp.]